MRDVRTLENLDRPNLTPSVRLQASVECRLPAVGTRAMAVTGHRNGLCVLTLHRVVNACKKDHDILWKSFRSLLDTIVESADAVETQLDPDASLRTGSVVLTFDDGTEDHVQVGEELAKRGMAGIFFVPAGKVGTPGRLSIQQLRGLQALGHVLGSHSFSDIPLRNGLTRQQITRELGDSKAFLEDALGTEVLYFAPPGGIGCRWLSRELRAHGYQASRAMVWGIYRSPHQRWTIPCVPVTEFTLAHGWVRAALSAHALPFAMRAAWPMKSIVPAPARRVMRKILHHRFRNRS